MSTPEQGNTAVVDRRPVPRGVLPKGIQTWLMVGIAGVILLIILFAGQPQAPERRVQAAAAPAPTSPDRVRHYQERLNAINAQLAMNPMPERPAMDVTAMTPVRADEPQRPAQRVDPMAVEKQRRNYESLFASNVVVSRRQPLQRSETRQSAMRMSDSLDASPGQ